jgi:hypothetical protein
MRPDASRRRDFPGGRDLSESLYRRPSHRLTALIIVHFVTRRELRRSASTFPRQAGVSHSVTGRKFRGTAGSGLWSSGISHLIARRELGSSVADRSASLGSSITVKRRTHQKYGSRQQRHFLHMYLLCEDRPAYNALHAGSFGGVADQLETEVDRVAQPLPKRHSGVPGNSVCHVRGS